MMRVAQDELLPRYAIRRAAFQTWLVVCGFESRSWL